MNLNTVIAMISKAGDGDVLNKQEAKQAISFLERMTDNHIPNMRAGLKTLEQVKLPGESEPYGWVMTQDYRDLLVDTIGEWIGIEKKAGA